MVDGAAVVPCADMSVCVFHQPVYDPGMSMEQAVNYQRSTMRYVPPPLFSKYSLPVKKMRKDKKPLTKLVPKKQDEIRFQKDINTQMATVTQSGEAGYVPQSVVLTVARVVPPLPSQQQITGISHYHF